MANDNGRAPEAAQKGQVTRVPVPSAPGVYRLRYLTAAGLYLGELEFYAIDQSAAKVIAADLFTLVTGIVLPVAT